MSNDQEFDDDPNAPTQTQLLVKNIETMMRKTGDVHLLMELDEVCIISDEKERFTALFKLKEKVAQR